MVGSLKPLGIVHHDRKKCANLRTILPGGLSKQITDHSRDIPFKGHPSRARLRVELWQAYGPPHSKPFSCQPSNFSYFLCIFGHVWVKKCVFSKVSLAAVSLYQGWYLNTASYFFLNLSGYSVGVSSFFCFSSNALRAFWSPKLV